MALAAANSKLYARASLFTVGLAWTLPFLQPYHYFPITSFYSEWLAFALSLTAATLLVGSRHSINLPVPLVSIAPIGLIVVYTVHVGLGRVPYPEQALSAALYLMWASLLLVHGAALRREFQFQEIAVVLSWALVIGGIVSALIGILQHYGVPEPLEPLVARKVSETSYGNLLQRNHFANQLSLALAGLAYLYACSKIRIAFVGMAAAVLLIALVFSGSRASWLYLLLLGVLSVVWHARDRSLQTQRLLVVSASLLGGLVLLHWIATAPVLQPATAPTVTSGQRMLDSATWVSEYGTFASAPGLADRIQEWRYAWWMFVGSPILGVGLGQYAWHHFEYLAQTGNLGTQPFVAHAHNIVFHMLAEAGVVGALLVLVPALVWVAGLRRLELELEYWWLLTLLGIIGIHSLLEFPLWYSYFLGIAALLFGLGANHVITVGLKRTGPLVVGVVLVVGWLHAVMILGSYKALESLAFGKKATAALSAESTSTTALMSVYREPVLRPYVELVLSFGIAISKDHLHDKLELSSRATRFAPIGYVLYRRALLLAMNEQRDEALRLLGQAAVVFPGGLAEVVALLQQLSRSHPEQFVPLLEAASRSARR